MTKGLVDPYTCMCTGRDLPRRLVESDGKKLAVIFVVYGLQKELRLGKDGKPIAGDVDLTRG